MKKLFLPIFIVLILLLALTRSAVAVPTTTKQAEKAVRGWLKTDTNPLGMELRASIKKVDAFSDADSSVIYYIVYLDPSGYVVVPADDEVEPIVGFSSGDEYDPSPENPMGALVSADMCDRVVTARKEKHDPANPKHLPFINARSKWQNFEALADTGAVSPTVIGSVSDVRVSPLVQSKWSQSTECGNYCYNYYTPNNYACGCVATAMAQLMRFYQYPSAPSTLGPFTIGVDGVLEQHWLMGGNYAWSNMVLDPNCSTTLTQRQAIGTLTHDSGVAVGMDYSSSGSGADTLDAASAFKNVFTYSNAIKGYNNGNNISISNLLAMLNPNLDAGFPCLLGISGSPGGHAIVCDGYGYNTSTLYHHLNMGWAGSSDAWYNLPTIDTGSGTFTIIYKCINNVYVTGSGEIIGGRVTYDTTGGPFVGATVTATGTGGPFVTTTNDKGVYALAKVHSGTTYTISVSAPGYSFSPSSLVVTTGTSVDYSTASGNKWANNFITYISPEPPPIPDSISYPTSNATGQYTVSWAASSGATSYQLERSDDGGSTWSPIYSGSGTSYSESIGNGSYRYHVKATNISGSSDWRTGDWDCVVYILPPPMPDSISYPTSSATGQYTVSWSASSGATSYQLEWSDDGGNNWSEIYSGSNTSYPEDIGNGSYRYRVKATNSADSSDWKTGDWDCVVYIPPVYCSASGSTCDEYISGVVVGAINNTGTGCSHYADYTAMSTTVNIGQGYVVTVTNGHSDSLDQCGIWVDWNRDYSFDDAGETITVSGTPGRGPYTAVITAPDNAVLGNTRMRVRITYTDGLSPCGSATYGEVEDYTINVAESICLAQKLDGFETGNFSVLPWITSGNADWTVTSANKNSGIYSAKAGTITHNQSTSLEFTFEVETGNITFCRKVSSESNCDWLRFYIDGVQQAEWSGELGWAEFTYPISAGTRNFKWTYSKDYSVSSGSDTAWIDDITFPIAIPCLVGDFDHDGDVDTDDLGTFCEGWLTDDTVTDIAPTDGDGIVDMMDFAVFAQNWLDGTSP